jgi:hypothetical protein
MYQLKNKQIGIVLQKTEMCYLLKNMQDSYSLQVASN